MSREYIARDPRTGLPLNVGNAPKRKKVESVIDEGPWSIIRAEDIIPLASGEINSVTVNWKWKDMKLGKASGVRALSRLIGIQIHHVHNILEEALIDQDDEVRIAALQALPLVAEQHSGELFEVMEVLLDDPVVEVRQAASKCLGDVAPVFPSATHYMMIDELRHPVKSRRKEAWRGLRRMVKVWPDVVVDHLDDILQEDNVELRRESAKLLRGLIEKGGSPVWDLITWSMQDEDVQVRRFAANSLSTLANHYPKVALLVVEIGIFDDDDKVRDRIVKCLNVLDTTSMRFRSLVMQGVRHREVSVRMACIRLVPRFLSEIEARDLANELIRQELDPEIIERLESMIFDEELEGDESSKNRFLQPAIPIPDRDKAIMALEEVVLDGNSISPKPKHDTPIVEFPESNTAASTADGERNTAHRNLYKRKNPNQAADSQDETKDNTSEGNSKSKQSANKFKGYKSISQDDYLDDDDFDNDFTDPENSDRSDDSDLY
ncbi:MAG: hypothetical protein HOE92_05745 [Euryarchaeota archaeon]|jgi:hypothetical protein|nr:hypothetical protein [Euryarchaeota archaeon]MBT3971701.1 hypothetical protein [Euryarchaeota archaeon]MBT4408157.1 hypothetical protein [Euryarchaeota archaeon]